MGAIEFSPEMNELMTEFLDKIEGKSMPEVMQVLLEFKGRLPEDFEFTQEQKNHIVESALARMPENERNRYKAMLKVMKVI